MYSLEVENLKCDQILIFYLAFMSTMNRIAFLSHNLSLNWQSHHDKVLCLKLNLKYSNYPNTYISDV